MKRLLTYLNIFVGCKIDLLKEDSSMNNALKSNTLGSVLMVIMVVQLPKNPAQPLNPEHTIELSSHGWTNQNTAYTCAKTVNFNDFANSPDVDSDSITKAPKVKVYDMQAYDDSVALKNASINSLKGALIMIVESNKQEYIDLVEEVVNERMTAGQTRMAIILTKKEKGEDENVLIVGNGKPAYYLLPSSNMEAARADLVKTITIAYEKLITPLLVQKQVNTSH